MNPFEMVVLIVAIVSIAGVMRARHGAARRAGEVRLDTGPDEDTETRRLREELRALKERVAVLERIATDNDHGIALDREIEALRRRD